MSKPQTSQIAMISRPEKIVVPPTPRSALTPNVAASFEPIELSDVHALLITRKTTKSGKRKKETGDGGLTKAG